LVKEFETERMVFHDYDSGPVRQRSFGILAALSIW
jgi:hypothetical protein